jgi:hypothetical protein
MTRRLLAAAAAMAVTAAACGGDGPVAEIDPAQVLDTDPASTTSAAPAEPPPTEAQPATDAIPPTDATTEALDAEAVATAEQVDEYIAQAAAFDQVAAAAQFPDGLEFSAGGAPGYSRYVFRENTAGVVPTLVEGPVDGAVRCQDVELPCSYLDLKELHESGGAIPDGLGVTSDELATLVAQLDELNAFAEEHRDVDAACADNYVSDRIQTPNMGSHFYNIESILNGLDATRFCRAASVKPREGTSRRRSAGCSTRGSIRCTTTNSACSACGTRRSRR